MKIMAVDDDQVSLDLLSECLQEGGYEHVTLMASPAKAMKKLTDTAIPYDCILLDVEMPGKDGIELCAEIRRQPRYKNTPIIMITKHSDHAAIERAFSSGATDYVSKPFTVFEVITRIRVAERLVLERQAALDSYLSVRMQEPPKPRISVVKSASTDQVDLQIAKAKIDSDIFLSLGVFQNYLDQVTSVEGSETDLLAVKLHRIDEIFTTTTAAEFLGLLEVAAYAIHAEFAPQKVFVTHAGNGILFCACKYPTNRSIDDIELSLLAGMQARDLPAVCYATIPLQISAGEPFCLKPRHKLNFNRVAKVAITRVEMRDPVALDAKSNSRRVNAE